MSMLYFLLCPYRLLTCLQSQPPEQRFAQQLEQLAAMGFYDRQQNIQGYWLFLSFKAAFIFVILFRCHSERKQITTVQFVVNIYFLFHCSADSNIWGCECSRGTIAVTEITVKQCFQTFLFRTLTIGVPFNTFHQSHVADLHFVCCVDINRVSL